MARLMIPTGTKQVHGILMLQVSLGSPISHNLGRWSPRLAVSLLCLFSAFCPSLLTASIKSKWNTSNNFQPQARARLTPIVHSMGNT